MIGGLVAQCVYAEELYALYSVWGLLGILLAAAAVTLNGLMKFTPIFEQKNI